MFILSSVIYIIGILSYFIFIDGDYNNYFLIASLFMMLFFLKFHPTFTNPKSYFFLLFCLGMWVSFISLQINNTYLLKEKIDFETIYAEISKVEKSNYNNRQYLYLKNVILGSQKYETQSPENIKLKLLYNRSSNIIAGDIIKASVSLFPPSEPIFPFGFNFQKNNLYKNISANGYIIGEVRIIKDSDSFRDDSIISKILNLFELARESFKTNIKDGIIKYVPKDTASYLIAITLGEYSFLPKDSVNNLRNSSLAHLISISGYHVSVICAFLFFFIRYGLSFFSRISLNYDTKKLSALITIGFLLIYILIVGNHTPAVRATIMSIAFLITLVVYWKSISFNSLFLAGVIILTISPYLIFSASFLLSFIATLALIYFCNLKIVRKLDILSKKNFFYRGLFLLGFSMSLTLFIEISIFPMVAFYFGMIPLNGVFANTLSSPVFSFIVMPGMILYFITPIFIGKYFVIIAGYAWDLILYIAKIFANFKYSVFYVDFFSGSLLVIMLLLYIAGIRLNNRYSIIMLVSYLLLAVMYLLSPSPDIIIESSGKSLAIKENNEYFFSKTSDKFIKSLWFKNPNFDKNKTLEEISNIECRDSHCIINIKNTSISVSENRKYFKEDCGNIDIIIISNDKLNQTCSKGILIDINFLEKNGATKIYLKDKPIILSAKDNYFKYLMKFFLQYI